MAYPFDETFATGIPTGFGAFQGQGGASATYSAGQQAVDLVYAQNNTFWKITAADFSTDFWFEMDWEIVAAAYTPPHFGINLYDGTPTYEMHRIVVYSNYWQADSWTSGGGQYNAQYPLAQAPWAIVGARKLIRLDARKFTGTAGMVDMWCVRISLDGTPLFDVLVRDFSTLQPAIFGYGGSFRLHRAAGGTPSALPALTVSNRGMPTLAALNMVNGEPVLTVSNRGMPPLATLNMVKGATSDIVAKKVWPSIAARSYILRPKWGNGQIVGTVKEKGSPADTPLHRKVVLLDEATLTPVGETWSNATTGAYAFTDLDRSKVYTAIAFDYLHNYRAVAADNLTPEAMP